MSKVPPFFCAQEIVTLSLTLCPLPSQSKFALPMRPEL
jgi:hypothetical protein